MTNLAYLLLITVIAASPPAFADSAESLNAAFADESRQDEFVTPTAIGGPLDAENPADQWRLDDSNEWFTPPNPIEVFPDGETECTPAPCVPTSRRMIYDTGIVYTKLGTVDGFGVSDVDARSTLIVPVFIKGSPLRLALGGGTTMISAPSSINVPSQLYNFTAELRCLIPLRETWAVEVGAGGGVFSDMTGSIGEGFRVTGRAIFIKEVSPQLKYSFGALYLGRKNLPAMPVAGLIYTPADDFKVELLIPRTRVMRRIAMTGACEHWGYFGVEIFGGNTWAITQTNGAQDTFIYKDNRIIAGYEAKIPGGLAGRIEAGYVMSRKVSFTNDPTTFTPGGTMMLRAGLTY